MKSRGEQILTTLLAVIAIMANVLQLLKVDIHSVPLVNLLFVIKLILVALIARDGSFIKSTIYSTAAGISAFILIIGSLFKIMHWTGADVMLMIGFSLLIVAYSLWFALKSDRQLLDFAKWFWVAALCLSLLFRIFHWDMREMLEIGQEAAFILMVVLHLSSAYRAMDGNDGEIAQK